jgi:hypothetical protein
MAGRRARAVLCCAYQAGVCQGLQRRGVLALLQPALDSTQVHGLQQRGAEKAGC